jgi:hypothetical protein
MPLAQRDGEPLLTKAVHDKGRYVIRPVAGPPGRHEIPLSGIEKKSSGRIDHCLDADK